MDWVFVLDFIYEISYLLGVWLAFFMWATSVGRQAMINLIFGLYLALLLFEYFPYTNYLIENLGGSLAQATGQLVIFGIFAFLMTMLATRVMPVEFQEKTLESLPKKFILSGAASVLVLVFSFQVLPVTEFLTPGTPLQSIFGPEEYFFWWLLSPLAVLFVL